VRIILFILILSFSHTIDASSSKSTKILNPDSGEALLLAMSPLQRALWTQYQAHQGSQVSTLSEITTFISITHALEHTNIWVFDNALELVDEITEVNGEIIGARPARQFNIAVKWKENTPKYFEASGFLYRVGWDHGGEWGLSLLSSSHGVHVLFSRQNRRIGHVHVDYRMLTKRGAQGHYQFYDADVRAVGPEVEITGKPIDNYSRHTLWFGEIPGYKRSAL
jgi:hypothetical protein